MRNLGYLSALGKPLPTYAGPPWRQPEPEEPVTPEQVAAWRARHQATCSPKIAAILCALERDYGVRSA